MLAKDRLGNNVPIPERRVGHVVNVPESCVLETGHAPKMGTHRHVSNVPPQLRTRQVISRLALNVVDRANATASHEVRDEKKPVITLSLNA